MILLLLNVARAYHPYNLKFVREGKRLHLKQESKRKKHIRSFCFYLFSKFAPLQLHRMMDDQPNHIFKEKKLIFLPEKLKSVVIQSTLRAVGVVNRFGLTVHVFDENWQTVCNIWSVYSYCFKTTLFIVNIIIL